MTTREHHGWHDPRPCPPWCTVTDHLDWRVRHGSDDFWHKGAVVTIRTEDETPNRDPIDTEVYLSQHVHEDERGQNEYPIEVCIDYMTLTRENARILAGVLMNLADQAEDA